MLTIFTIPKPFTDPHISLIQKNAISSWKRIDPSAEIILIGDDPGVAEAAQAFGVRHIGEVSRNEFGTPLLNSAFELVRKTARFETMMYTNADIILFSDFLEKIKHLPKKNFLAIGKRIDIDITQEIDFNDPLVDEQLATLAKTRGALHSAAGIDYFIFNKASFADLPPFAVGRVGWDNWTVGESLRVHRYTIDMTEVLTVLHQNHAYTGNNIGAERKTNPEAQKNSSYIKNRAYAFTIEDANWKMTPSGLRKRHFAFIPFFKRYVKFLLRRG